MTGKKSSDRDQLAADIRDALGPKLSGMSKEQLSALSAIFARHKEALAEDSGGSGSSGSSYLPADSLPYPPSDEHGWSSAVSASVSLAELRLEEKRTDIMSEPFCTVMIDAALDGEGKCGVAYALASSKGSRRGVDAVDNGVLTTSSAIAFALSKALNRAYDEGERVVCVRTSSLWIKENMYKLVRSTKVGDGEPAVDAMKITSSYVDGVSSKAFKWTSNWLKSAAREAMKGEEVTGVTSVSSGVSSGAGGAENFDIFAAIKPL